MKAAVVCSRSCQFLGGKVFSKMLSTTTVCWQGSALPHAEVPVTYWQNFFYIKEVFLAVYWAWYSAVAGLKSSNEWTLHVLLRQPSLWHRLLRYSVNCLTESRRGSCGVWNLMGHGEGMSAWLKRVSQKEFLPLLVKYLYQHVCLRQKTINKKKCQVAQQEITLAALLFGFFFSL